MLKFCSKAAQESQTEKTALKKEGSDSEKASAPGKGNESVKRSRAFLNIEAK